MTTMLEAALACIAQGFKVFPVKPDKKPLTDHGLKDATQLQIRVKEFWEKYPDAGIGLVTDGFIVVDFDAKNGGLESKATIETKYGELPSTRTHRTGGGGLHYIYRNPNGTDIRNTVVLGGYQGVDLRANGGYIVAPPSLHESGARYEVLDDSQIAPAPAWLMEMATRRVPAPGSPTPGLIKHGERNHRLFKMAASMRRQGASEDTIYDAVKKCYENDCEHEPPITEDELHKIAKQGVKYPPGGNVSQVVNLVCMAEVKPETVSWLWLPYIPKGKLTLLEGDPGIGKSWVSLAIATAVSLGKGLPGQEPAEPSNVVIASVEDGLGDTIRPRLDAMGADISRIFAIDGVLTLDETGFTLLERYLERVKPTLLIMDPLFAYLGAGVDIHRANETRAVMARLARLAEKFGMAVLAVRHLTKGGMSKAIYRGLGSIDITAACRSVLLAGCDSENAQNRGLVHTKSNLTPPGPSIGYELRDDSFYWTGESSLTATQILAADNGAGTSELDEAITFLKDKLTGQLVLAKDVYQDAQNIGISKRTLERAKAKLQAKSRKEGDTWFWCLPSPTSPTLPYKEFGELENIEANKEVAMEGLGDLDHETALGMSVSEALKIWTAKGAPVIHLGPGENCLDLEKLLANKDVKPEHLLAVADWLRQRR